jgi:hypothetical protein
MNTDMVPVAQVAVQAGAIDRTELAWPERAAGLKIVDAATLATADEERGACRDLIKKAHERHDETCASAYKTWQLKCAERKADIDPLEAAVAIFDRGMKDFDAKEKQRAREAQRAIEAAAFTETVVEREAVIEHVETTNGTPVEVKAVMERPVTMPVAPTRVMETAAAPVRAAGSLVLPSWKGEMTDQFAFVMNAVLGAKPPKEVQDWVDAHVRRDLLVLLQPDKGAILSTARVVKDTTTIPGLRIWDDGKVQSTPKKAGS